MKPGIHPAYEEVNVTCACGHKFRTRSAHKGDIRVEICSSCHPFFTGKQKLIDTEGRVDRFQKKYQKVRDAAGRSQKETAGRISPALRCGPRSLRQGSNLRRAGRPRFFLLSRLRCRSSTIFCHSACWLGDNNSLILCF